MDMNHVIIRAFINTYDIMGCRRGCGIRCRNTICTCIYEKVEAALLHLNKRSWQG